MSAAVDIYIPAQWETSVSSVLGEAGFQVTARNRQLASGIPAREYACTRDGETITLTQTPLSDDSSHFYILGLSRPRGSAALLSALEALKQHGALDSSTYKHRSRNV